MSERKVPGAAGDKGRAARLATALRANLKRRKAQARAQGKDASAIAIKSQPRAKPQKSEEK
jgi:hypothetical protein